MPEFARPDNDDTLGGYRDEAAGTTNIFQSIDEVTFSDTDFIESGQNPAGTIYVAGASTITDPETSDGHVLRWRYGKSGVAGRTIEMKMELRQTTTVIATRTFSDVAGGGFVQDNYTLSGAEADAITDYSALNFQITSTVSGSGAGRRGQVSWVELEVPAGFAHAQVYIIG